jgi:hypothetical protein
MMPPISLFFLSVFTFLLVACTSRNNSDVKTYGDLDSARIASDTAMQVDMDLSYEYQQNLAQSDSVVFDFLAYDKPKGPAGKEWESKFHIIRRVAHSEDTVARGLRSGAVRTVWLSDLDRNGLEEIMFYEYPKSSKRRVDLIAYEMGTDHKAHLIQADMKEDMEHYKGMDTFFVSQDRLVRRYPYYVRAQDSTASGSDWQSYKLSSGKLRLENEKVEN